MRRVLIAITNLFWLWTVLGTAWAWFIPEHFTWFLGKFPGTDLKLTALGLGVIMLGMGVTLTLDDFARVLRTPWKVGVGVVAQFAIMPCIGWSVAVAFGLPDQLKLGLILVSCCPGGTASNVVCFLARANVALSVLMTMCSTMLAVVLTPYLTKGYASLAVPLKVDALAMVLTMVTIVLLPVIGGVMLNKFFGERLGVVRKVSPIISVLVIVLIVGAIVGKTRDNIVEHAATLLPAVSCFTPPVSRLVTGGRVCSNSNCANAGRSRSKSGCRIPGSERSWPRRISRFSAAAPCAISAFYHCIMGSFLASLWSRADSKGDTQGGGT